MVQACAPGKVILMGEHAVLHGCPALAMAIGLRSCASASLRKDRLINAQLCTLGLSRSYHREALLRYTRQVRQAWARARQKPLSHPFALVRGNDADHLIKCALGESLERFSDTDSPGLDLTLHSDLPLNAGFGSSAALAVCVPAALASLYGSPATRATLQTLAMIIEGYQHGQPSGIDHMTALLGSIIEVQPRPRGQLHVSPMPAGTAALHLAGAQLYHTGCARESTGEVIVGTRARLAGRNNPLLADMRQTIQAFSQLLRAPKADRPRLLALIRGYQQALEQLGVVPESIRQAVRAVERAGGAAKLCGAGALSGESAGCLLVFPSAQPLFELAAYPRIDTVLAAPGLQVKG
ncbi:mevalonate kinase family protein [Pseudomonas sp. S1_E04]